METNKTLEVANPMVSSTSAAKELMKDTFWMICFMVRLAAAMAT